MSESHYEITQHPGETYEATYSFAPDPVNPDAFANVDVAGGTVTQDKLIVIGTEDSGWPNIDVRLPPPPHGFTVRVRQGGVILFEMVGGVVTGA